MCLQYNCVNPKTSIDEAMEEAKMVTCGAIEGLLKKQGEAQRVLQLYLWAAWQLTVQHRWCSCFQQFRVLQTSLLPCHASLLHKGLCWFLNPGLQSRLTIRPVCWLWCAGLQPKDVDIIVSTCSIFCPTPSITSMIVNHFGMRTDVQSYHLGGMGCSNGVVAVNLIKDLLKVRHAGLARV
jgi:hypothetical protein